MNVVKQELIENQILELIKIKPDITDIEIASKLSLGTNEVRDWIRKLSDTRVKILVIDDEIDAVTPLKMSLESDDYNVVEAYSGREALEKILIEIPDLVLLDLKLPDMDGYDVINRLKKDSRTRLIPVIMLTGKGAIRDKIEGLEKGADDYVTKPFDMNELKARIRTVLRRSMVYRG